MASPNPELRARVAAIENWEPIVHALIHFDEDSARRRAAESSRGPLAGWSIAIKDISDWRGSLTRCNADFVPAAPAAASAPIVDALCSWPDGG